MAGHGLNRPPVYFLVALGLMALLDYVVPVLPLIVRPYRYAGAVFVALGLALAAWGALLFRRAGTGILPFTPATALVTRGPYRFTRNPMYLGMAAVLLGSVGHMVFALVRLHLPMIRVERCSGPAAGRWSVAQDRRIRAGRPGPCPRRWPRAGPGMS